MQNMRTKSQNFIINAAFLKTVYYKFCYFAQNVLNLYRVKGGLGVDSIVFFYNLSAKYYF